MFANLSPGAIGVRATIEEAAQLAEMAGFNGIDVDLGEAETYGIDRTKDLLAAHGLRIGGWGLTAEFRKDDETFRETLKELPRWAGIAQKLGCTRCSTWVLSGSNELPFDDNFRLLRNRFRECALVLKDYGCSLVLVPSFVVSSNNE